jgi:phosphate transport system substrate-binding protein
MLHRLYRSGFTVLVLCWSFVLSAETVLSEPISNAFGNTGDTVVMDETWKAKPVTYDKEVGSADLVVTLGQHTYPALKRFVEDFAQRKGIKVVIQQGTCGVSAKKLSAKMVDIGAFCCPPGKTDRLPGVEFHTIGIAPIALITNTSNEINEISTLDARNIFSGKTIKWSEVPVNNSIKLPGKDIKPVVRLHCKKRPGHWRHILDNENDFSAGIHEVGVIPDMIKEVADADQAIGFETLFMLEVHRKNGEVNVLSIDGHHPSELQYMLSAEYPFYRSFSLTTWNDEHTLNPLAQELVEEIKKHIEERGERYGMISAAELRQAGWKFEKDELVGEPDGNRVFSERE